MRAERLLSFLGAALSVISILVIFVLPLEFFPSIQAAFMVKAAFSALLGVGLGLTVVGVLLKGRAAPPPAKPKVLVREEAKVALPRPRGRILLYADLLAAGVLSAIFLRIMFTLPSEFFPSPTVELYAKLASSLLFGFSVSIFLLLLADLLRPPVIAVQIRPKPIVAPPKPAIKPLRAELPTSLVSRVSLLKMLAEKMSLGMSKDILEAGLTISPYRFACLSLFYTLVAIFICVPVAVALSLLVHPALLVLMLVPIAPLFIPKIKLRISVGDRRRGLEDELPFFTVLAAILQDAGINLYNSFMAIIGRGLFKQIERDALLLKRDVEFFFKSPLEALNDLGNIHPNEKMRGLLLGYTSEWRSGGDVVGYLESKAEDFLNDMTFKWRSYAERSTDLGETIISLFFIFPMLIVMSAFVFPAQAMTMTTAILAFVVPSVSAAVFGTVHTTQPKTYNVVGGSVPLAAAAGIVSSVASVLLGVPVWLCMASGLGAATAIYGAVVLLQMREINMVEKALPQFLRDITEYRKMGYDITRALLKIAEENVYNPAFNSILSAVYRQMRLGLRVSEVKVPTRSWLAKICFFLLGQVVESGGGTVRCLELLTNFVNRVVRTRAEARSMMRLYQILSAFTPIGLSFVTSLMFTLLTAFAASLAPGMGGAVSQLGPLAQIAEIPQGLVESCYLLTIAASISVAMLTAKTVDLTAKNTMWITINLALAAAGIAFSTQIGTMLMRIMMQFAGI